MIRVLPEPHWPTSDALEPVRICDADLYSLSGGLPPAYQGSTDAVEIGKMAQSENPHIQWGLVIPARVVVLELDTSPAGLGAETLHHVAHWWQKNHTQMVFSSPERNQISWFLSATNGLEAAKLVVQDGFKIRRAGEVIQLPSFDGTGFGSLLPSRAAELSAAPFGLAEWLADEFEPGWWQL